jgi:biopolymer transport protein ExbD
MRASRRDRQSREGIDISPLIDMVFILLIFFMVTTTFVKDMKVDIERPGAATAKSASTKAVRVHIDAGANIYIDGASVRPWMVQTRVRDLLEGAGSQQVLVIVDKRVPVERLIEVVDQCRLAGASEVGVASQQETD